MTIVTILPARRTFRHLFVATLLTAGVLAGLSVPSAHAMLGTCRTDPVLTLSNGVTLRIVDDIGTDISTISMIKHVVHLPSGVTLLSVAYDDGVSYKEMLTLSSDQAPGSYTSRTMVGLTSGNASVTTTATAWTTANAALPTTTATASGTTSAALDVSLTY